MKDDRRETAREMILNLRAKIGAIDTKMDNHLKHHEVEDKRRRDKDRLWTYLFIGVFIAMAGVVFEKAIDKLL